MYAGIDNDAMAIKRKLKVKYIGVCVTGNVVRSYFPSVTYDVDPTYPTVICCKSVAVAL